MASLGGKFPYVVVLKNTVTRQVNVLGYLLNLASCIFFIKEFLFVLGMHYLLAAAILIVLGMLLRNALRQRNGKKIFFDRAYLIVALLWLQMPYLQWLFIPFVILALLEHQVKFPLEIGFSEKHIVFNTFFRKKYDWSQLSNVMLKDGLLTMDFRSNRILQREIVDEEDEDDATEEEFNVFCREQLKKNM